MFIVSELLITELFNSFRIPSDRLHKQHADVVLANSSENSYNQRVIESIITIYIYICALRKTYCTHIGYFTGTLHQISHCSESLHPLCVRYISVTLILLLCSHIRCVWIGENRLEKLHPAPLVNDSLAGHAIFSVPIVIVAGSILCVHCVSFTLGHYCNTLFVVLDFVRMCWCVSSDEQLNHCASLTVLHSLLSTYSWNVSTWTLSNTVASMFRSLWIFRRTLTVMLLLILSNKPNHCIVLVIVLWMTTIQQDLKSDNLSLNEATDVAQNRPLLRLMSTFGTMHS